MDYFMLGIFEGNKSPVTNQESATSHGINVRPRKNVTWKALDALEFPMLLRFKNMAGRAAREPLRFTIY